jgi:iron complex transport system substrate-binding protein
MQVRGQLARASEQPARAGENWRAPAAGHDYNSGVSRPFAVSRRTCLLGLAAAVIACQRAKSAGSGARRIISLTPSTTEAVFSLGAGARLVGRSRFCDYPPLVKNVPAVGGFVDPSFEAILGLAPDLVVGVRGPGGRALHDRLNTRGIATYFPPTDSIAEIEAMLRGVAERLGDPASGERLVAEIAGERRRVRDAIASSTRPRALLVFGIRPIVVAGSEGFAGEMLVHAGGTNAVSSPARYPTLGIEQVMALNPDVVIDATGAASHEGEGFSADLPGWRDVPAIRRGRLVRIRDERVLRPGPRVGGGLLVLARALHPELKLAG